MFKDLCRIGILLNALACSPAVVGLLFAQDEVSFLAARRDFAVGLRPESVIVGDFNNDKIQDLATANMNSNDVSILLGNGDGTFRPAQNFRVDGRAHSLAVGDFNGDELQDLAVAGSRLFILLGNGDGTFRTAQTLGVVGNWISVGDFNGDKLPDLVIATSVADTVSILLGNGDGTFGSARSFAVGRYPTSIIVGDFNADEIPDLAVANGIDFMAPGTVSILLGQGDGTFESAQEVRVGPGPLSIAVGDFNGDAIQDLAVAGRSNFVYRGYMSILLGHGDGAFGPARTIELGDWLSSVTVGDFNGDNWQDLAVADLTGGFVFILPGNGDGTFGRAERFVVRSFPSSVTVGDFNGDNWQDLAVATWGISGSYGAVSILLGNGDGTFGSAQTVGVGGDAVIVADFNGDDVDDLAVADRRSNNISILLGLGDGKFGAAQHIIVGCCASSITAGDFNGDKTLDLAVANEVSNNVAILLGHGDGTFGPTQTFAVGTGPRSVTIGDFNGDSVLDLAVANWGHTRCTIRCTYVPDTRVSILLGRGDGTFEPAQNFEVGRGPSSIAMADFNGDAIPDLAVNIGSILLGHGDGTFGLAQYFGVGGYAQSHTVGDFNGDMLPDLAAVSGGLSILINNTPRP